MRVIAGKHRSRVLKEFKGNDIRPTSDRAKESLFNILRDRVYESSFLDLFCGTGGIGIEAISRGASKVVFIDNSSESVKLTLENLSILKEKSNVFKNDCTSYIRSTHDVFDIIFLDPPYALDVSELLVQIAKSHILADCGLIIYEHGADSHILDNIEGLKKVDSRKYGACHFEFYERI